MAKKTGEKMVDPQAVAAELSGEPIRGEEIAILPAGSDAAAVKDDDKPPTSGLPQTLDDLTESVSRSFDLSVTAALSLSIPVVGSVSGGMSRRVIVLERVAYKPLTNEHGS